MREVKILIADGHPILRKGIKAVFDDQPGYAIVGIAEDGIKAVEEAGRTKPDVVIMDITMPKLDGIEATRRIIEENPEIKVIILSMHYNNQFAVEALRAGARAYVLKGSEADEVIKAAKNVMAGKRYVSPEVFEEILSGYYSREKKEPDPFDTLTDKEKEVLRLIAEGATSMEIGEILSKSVSSIKKYRTAIMKKLSVSDMAGMIRIAVSKGLIKKPTAL